MKTSLKNFLFFVYTLTLSFVFSSAGAQDTIITTSTVGEVFGNPVTAEEFAYYYKTALIFTRSGNQEKNGTGKEEERTAEERRTEAWQNLIFIRDANRLGIGVSQDELQAELRRLLKEKEIEYGSPQYETWIRATFQEDSKTFERRIEDLLTINKLLKLKTDPDITVTEEEMKEKFLNQYNSFESEYILFANAREAQDFAKKVKTNPALWKQTYDAKKPLGQKGSCWINIMSLEAIIDLWKVPKNDAYAILNSRIGDFVPAKNYYGDAVFRLLFKRLADEKEYDAKKQEYYRKMIASSKKYKVAKEYLDDLFKRAAFRDYVKEKETAAKIEKLKERSSAVLRTNHGDIEVKLFPDIAPLACENFIGLAEKGYYNGLIFHRVIKDFMIQGGDPNGNGTGGQSLWGDRPFADEISDKVVFDRPGMLAMANSGPDSNKSQFFITVKPAPWLNGRHTIFGEVVSGMETVKKIELVPVDANNKPKQAVTLLEARLKK